MAEQEQGTCGPTSFEQEARITAQIYASQNAAQITIIKKMNEMLYGDSGCEIKRLTLRQRIKRAIGDFLLNRAHDFGSFEDGYY